MIDAIRNDARAKLCTGNSGLLLLSLGTIGRLCQSGRCEQGGSEYAHGSHLQCGWTQGWNYLNVD